MPHRVLIIDDSAVVRRALTLQLQAHHDIVVVGTAADPYIARERIAELRPDVLTLDLEMPRMDGLTFLRKLMAHHPMPVIVVSSITPAGCETALACLDAGAAAVLCKPSAAYAIGELGAELASVIRDAAEAPLRPRLQPHAPLPTAAAPAPAAPQPGPPVLAGATNRVIALGCSTGGTEALAHVLPRLPRSCPGVLIVQHMPAGFTTQFARRLNEASAIEVREARDGDTLGPGLALLAPGSHHMRLVRDGAVHRVRLADEPPVSRHRPSVDVLFHSVAQHAASNALGILMTGMGRDGADGMLAMRRAGAHTIAQDEHTCVVFGMPRAAIDLDAARQILPLDQVPAAIERFTTARPAHAA